VDLNLRTTGGTDTISLLRHKDAVIDLLQTTLLLVAASFQPMVSVAAYHMLNGAMIENATGGDATGDILIGNGRLCCRAMAAMMCCQAMAAMMKNQHRFPY
jgi:hypothetical protein